MNRYSDINTTKSLTGRQMKVNNIYPDIPLSDTDFYVITTSGDRLDILADQFYSDSTLWWILASANSLSGDSLVAEPGTQLRVPTDIQSIINKYKSINNIR